MEDGSMCSNTWQMIGSLSIRSRTSLRCAAVAASVHATTYPSYDPTRTRGEGSIGERRLSD
jgi:hypothetical protein